MIPSQYLKYLLIVDDLSHVWPELQDNVVSVTPYHAFKEKEELIQLMNQNDCYLYFAQFYLQELHRAFF